MKTLLMMVEAGKKLLHLFTNNLHAKEMFKCFYAFYKLVKLLVVKNSESKILNFKFKKFKN